MERVFLPSRPQGAGWFRSVVKENQKDIQLDITWEKEQTETWEKKFIGPASGEGRRIEAGVASRGQLARKSRGLLCRGGGEGEFLSEASWRGGLR